MDRVTNYDSVAAGYDVRYRHYDFSEIEESLSAFIDLSPRGAVLEVGCGTGYWLKALRKSAPLVVGVDLSAQMIARAKGSGAHLARARAESLPWMDATFDSIVCINALHHFADRDAFFAECRRVLRPGGGVFTVGLDPHAGRDTWWIYDFFPETVAIDQRRYPAVKTIRAELARAGFSWAESSAVQTFEHSIPAALAFARGLVSRSFSSQLTVLSDEEFDTGIARLRAAMDEAARTGGEFQLLSALHLFAVVGRLAT